MNKKCTIHCFRCGREVQVERDEDGYMYSMLGPHDGGALFFQTHGNYGSTIFDSIMCAGEEFLEIVICDDCVVAHQNDVDHVKVERQRAKRVVALFESGKE